MKTNDILKQEWKACYDAWLHFISCDKEVILDNLRTRELTSHVVTRHNFALDISDEAMDKKLLDIIDEEIETNNTLPLGQYNAAMHALILLKKRLTSSTNEQTT